MITRPDGTTYCPMRGHAELDCSGYPNPDHMALSKAGVGWSDVPGPSDAELRAETRADLELVRDEYHGVYRDEIVIEDHGAFVVVADRGDD